MQSPKPDFQPFIEPWELTAFALQELEGEDLVRVSQYIAVHPECLAEIEQIQNVAETLRQQLNSSTRGMALDAQRAHQVQTNLHATSLESNPAQPSRWTRGRTAATVLCALAATVLVAMFVFPSMKTYTSHVLTRSETEIGSGTREAYGFARESESASTVETVASVREYTGPTSGQRSSDASMASANASPLQHNAVKDFDGEARRKSSLEASNNQPLSEERNSKMDAVKSLEGQSQRAAVGAENEQVVLADELKAIESKTPSSSLSLAVAENPASGKNLGGGGMPSGGPPAGYSADGGRAIRGRSDRLAGGAGGMGGGGMGGMGGMPTTTESSRNLASLPLGGSAPVTPSLNAKESKSDSKFGELNPPSGDQDESEDRFRLSMGKKYRLDREKQASNSSGEFPDELRQNVPSRRRMNPAPTGDRIDVLVEMPFTKVAEAPLSTFSIDVDTASYSKLRQYVLEQHTLPTPGSLRLEELINYFEYDYAGPTDGSPFAAHLRLADCPWNPEHRLVRVALQAKKVDTESRPASNLVFLIDVSGSMAAANKLPLVKRTLTLLASQLRPDDRVAIVVYAGAAGCVLPSTLGAQKEAILASINELQSGGSTNGGQGIELAYKIAKDNYIPEGINRVLLCTDGDFNVGVTGTDQLVAMMKENAKSNVFLTCLGYGIGNYNDSMMEKIADQGNGTYAMVDNELEARRIMVEQLSGTLMTVAKDVKIQVEFNPSRVASYRLIGYENRKLATADFDNDRKDAGEIGAGHRVTALYEIVPVGKEGTIPGNIELRYGVASDDKPADARQATTDSDNPSAHADEWMLLKIRSKQPEASESTKQEFLLKDVDSQLVGREQADLEWAVCVAEFGLLLRHSPWAPGADWDRLLSRAAECILDDPYRRECYTIMQQSKPMSERQR